MNFGYWLQEYTGDNEGILSAQKQMNEDDFWPYFSETIDVFFDYMNAQGYCQHHWEESLVNVRRAYLAYCIDMTGYETFDEVEKFIHSSGPTKFILLNHDERLRELQERIYEDDNWPSNALTFLELEKYIIAHYCEHHTSIFVNDLMLGSLLCYRKDV